MSPSTKTTVLETDRSTSGPIQDVVIVSAVVVATTLACATEILVPLTGQQFHLVTLWIGVVLAALAGGLSAEVLRDRSLPIRTREAWVLLSVVWGLTVVARALPLIGAEAGPQSVGGFAAAALPLGVAPLVLLALLRLTPRTLATRDIVSAGLDAVTAVVAAWMWLWHTLAGPGANRGAAVGVGAATDITVLAVDLLVLGGAAYVAARCPRGRRRLTVLLLAAFACSLVATDALRAATAWGMIPHTAGDLSAVVPPIVFIAAALEKRRRLRERPDDEGDPVTVPVAAVPYVAVGAIYLVLVWAAATDPDGVLVLLTFAGALPLVALARRAITISDVSRLAREREALAGGARFRAIVHHSSDLVMVVDSGWILTYVSPSAQIITGHKPSHICGNSIMDLVHPDDAADAANRLREAVADPSRGMVGRWRLRRSDQTFVELDTVAVNLLADEHVRGIVLTARDASERRSLEAQLTHQAFHDPLTGLANRALFEDRVQHALARRRGEDHRDAVGVVFIDVDHFKTINDTLGHTVGDAVLKAIATRLLGNLRAFDTAARLGGDEFAVLVDDIHQRGDAVQVGERVSRAFKEPLSIDGRHVHAAVSVGVALAAHGDSANDLLRNADLAMYLAKSRGRSQMALFEPAMQAAAITRSDLQRDLGQALERDELSLVYQPMHALESRAVAGAEALLRWVHPTRGPIPPSTFVPLAEEAGLMVPIGRWVLERACRDAERWRRDRHGRSLRVSVNLSVRQIPEQSLFGDVEAALRSSGLPPGALVLELTESMLLEHTDEALKLLQRFKGLGVRVAIDDFGTGYSSLSYLQRLPIDILKIDRAFVDVIVQDEHAAQLTRAIVSLSESMSLVTVAEGVENATQAEKLRQLGCDYAQGYHFGMPMSADALASHMQSRMLIGA